MAKSTASTNTDSTIKPVKNQDKFLVKAAVYAQLKSLHRFDSLIFKKMSDSKCPGALKSIDEWDAFRAEYQNSGTKQ